MTPNKKIIPLTRNSEGQLGAISVTVPSAAGLDCGDERVVGLGFGTDMADRARPIAAAVAHESDSLAPLEARLTKEILAVAGAINNLGSVAIAVGEELPDAAHLDKIDMLFLSQLSFCCSEILLKLINNSPLLGKQGELVDKLRLQSHELMTEVQLNGQHFLMIALPNQGLERIKGSNGG
jgi:hypothetical protein